MGRYGAQVALAIALVGCGLGLVGWVAVQFGGSVWMLAGLGAVAVLAVVLVIRFAVETVRNGLRRYPE